jgi:hypothetical protein
MCSVCFAVLESIETLVHRAHSHVALRVHLASSAPCLQIWKFRELNSQLATAATCALQVETSFFKKRKNATKLKYPQKRRRSARRRSRLV